MLGYELADILLFDLETLIEVDRYFLESTGGLWLLGIALNIACSFFLRSRPWLVGKVLSVSWILPGYFFMIAEFSEIYWPAKQVGMLAIAMGLFQWFLQVNKTVHPLAFALITLVPTSVSLAVGSVSMTMGTSISAAALGSLAFYINDNRKTSRAMSLFSIIWCLSILAVVSTLIFFV